jgi:hypothetical protein
MCRVADGEVKRKFTELGATGLQRWAGQVDEEFLPQLRGRERSRSSARCVTTTPSSVRWSSPSTCCCGRSPGAPSLHPDGRTSRPSSSSRTCMDDMSHTWEDLISEILSMLVRLVVARDGLQAPGRGRAQPEVPLQAQRRAHRLAQDADPLAGDSPGLDLRRRRRGPGDEAARPS